MLDLNSWPPLDGLRPVPYTDIPTGTHYVMVTDSGNSDHYPRTRSIEIRRKMAYNPPVDPRDRRTTFLIPSPDDEDTP